MLLQVREIQRIHSRNHYRDAKSVAAAAALVENEPIELVNAERQRSGVRSKGGQVSKLNVILETNEPGRRVE